MHPPGWAFEKSLSPEVDNSKKFFAAKDIGKGGRYLPCAISSRPLSKLEPGVLFPCDFALVIGCKYHREKNKLYYLYRKWNFGSTSYSTLQDAHQDLSDKDFVTQLFEDKVSSSEHGSIYFCYLNQISGVQLFPESNEPMATWLRDDILYHEITKNPTVWNLQRGYLWKQDENLGLITGPSGHSYNKSVCRVEKLDNEIARCSGTTKILQSKKCKTLVMYALQSFCLDPNDGWLLMPLPECPDGEQDFVVLLPSQKEHIDTIFIQRDQHPHGSDISL